MVQLNRRWAPHRSEGNLSCMTTLFDTSSLHFNVQHLTSSLPPLYTPFLHSLSTYSTLSIDQPPFDTPSYTLTLNFFSTSSLHPLPISPLYILSIVGYCHGTAQLPLGSPLVTRQPILYDNPPLTLPLYTPMSNF